jgi:DNA-binding MarR family transcriptional regulator
MNNLTQHLEAYKQALKDQDQDTLIREKATLTETVAWALLEQDEEQIQAVRACLANLAPLADHFDETGKRGDRWRALGEVLRLIAENNKPLEQLRLTLPNTVSGKILKEIQAQAGITPSELSKRLGKKDSHISNEIKKLDTARLIVRLKRGKNYELFLSVLGKEALDSVTPEQNSQMQVSVSETYSSISEDFSYINPERLTRFNSTPQLPFPRVH